MKFGIRGGGGVTLSKSDYLAGGGEGDVYVKGGMAYKVYHNPSACMPEGKIRDLQRITDDDIIRPKDILLDAKGAPVGYSMRFIDNAAPLCTVFPRSYRERNGLDGKDMLHIVQTLQERVSNVHAAGILVVDLNEMNWLVSANHREVYGIDTDSYQTPAYRATAIMPSIRDWTVEPKDFDERSDWFSFGILAFQLFTGIHPFKGKHPTLKGFEERVKARVSVYHPDVRVPPVAYPLDVIPDAYAQWFKAMFDNGQRLPPPGGSVAPVAYIIPASRFSDSGMIIFSEVMEFAGPIMAFFQSGSEYVGWTREAIFVGHQEIGKITSGVPPKGVVFTAVVNRPVLVSMDGAHLRLTDLREKKDIPVTVAANDVSISGNRVYVRMDDRIVRVDINELRGQVKATYERVCTCMPRATKMWPGMATQNMLGSAYVIAFHDTAMNPNIRVKELDGHKVIDAAYKNGVAMLITHNADGYHRFTIRFDAGFRGYDLGPFGVEHLSSPEALDFIVLDSGIVLSRADDKLFLYSGKTGSNSVREVDATDLIGARLVISNGRAAAIKGTKVYDISLKK